MLATILQGPKATQTTINIIETYSKLRNLTGTINDIGKNTDDRKKKSLIRKSGELLTELIDDDLHIDQSETTIELNFAVLKLKHTIKRI